MKHIIPFFLLLLAGCKSEMPAVPEQLIQPEKMALILAEMHFADALAETKAQAGMNEKLLTREYYDVVYKKHGVSFLLFRQSYQFYEQNPEWLNKIYDDVLMIMSRQESESGKQEKQKTNG